MFHHSWMRCGWKEELRAVKTNNEAEEEEEKEEQEEEKKVRKTMLKMYIDQSTILAKDWI